MGEKRTQQPNAPAGAPETPARPRRDVAVPEHEHGDSPAPSRRAAEEQEVRGDHMPAGADEPGAGL
jgi:hypothetical protein